ncbi:MAG: HVO_0649 family zinc finger protein [Haloferacaceae archaeon]
MSIGHRGGTTPLDRLGARYDRTALTCPYCGYDDHDGSWRARTSGDRIRYEHRCPSCDAVSSRTLRLH